MKKSFLSLMFAVFAVFAIAAIFPSRAPTGAAAAESLDERIRYFTDNDDLVNEDNTLSDKTIQIFKEELKNAGTNDAVPDLPKVIPAELLRVQAGVDRDYRYFGKEYGYVVMHRTYGATNVSAHVRLHVFLIDFKWINDKINEPRAQIEPLVMSSFSYSVENGEDVWRKEAGNNGNDLYITNVAFGAILLNENALNYGDVGYLKKEDPGLIIQQTRLNFSGVHNVSGGGWGELAQFAVSQVLGRVSKTADFLISLWDLGSAINAMSTQTVEIACGNEANITTELSRAQQLEDDTLDSFSRATFIQPIDSVYIGPGGFAETVTLFNDTNVRSRFIQTIQFDIVSRNGTEFTYVNVNDNNERETCRTAFGQTLFDEEERYFEPTLSERFPLYVLEGGEHPIKVTAPHNGKYRLSLLTDKPFVGEIKEIETSEIMSGQFDPADQSCYAYLKANRTYYWTTKFGDPLVCGLFDAKLEFAPDPVRIGQNILAFDGSREEFLKLQFDDRYYYALSDHSGDAIFREYDGDFQLLQTATGNIRIENGNNELRYVCVSYPSEVTTELSLICQKERDLSFVTYSDEIASRTIVNDEIVALPDPASRFGYTFAGWWDNVDYFGERVTADNLSEIDRAEITLYAKWNPIEYSVSLKERDGTAIDSLVYTADRGLELPQPEKEGYIFKGWYADSACTDGAYSRIEQGDTGNKTFYAKWVQEKYTVTLSIDYSSIDNQDIELVLDGQSTSQMTFDIDYQSNYVLPAVSTKGFTFEGWYWEGNQVTSKQGVSLKPYDFEENITLAAHFTRHEYTVKVQKEDGKYLWMINGGFSEIQNKYGYTPGFCPNCQIVGWRNSVDPDIANMAFEALYRDGYKYSHLVSDPNDASSVFCWKDLELENGKEYIVYAHYEVEAYDIYFENFDTQKTRYQFNERLVYPEYSKTGYTWGWYDDAGNVFDCQFVPDLTPRNENNGSIRLHLEETPIIYGIEYVLDGGSFGAQTVKYTYTVDDEYFLPVPARENFRFVGWFKDEELTKQTRVVAQGTTGDLIFYAKWIELYTITFREQDGYFLRTQLALGDLMYLPSKNSLNLKTDRTYYTGKWVGKIRDEVVYPGLDFGSDFVLDRTEDVNFEVQWTGFIYNIDYKNIMYGSIRAYVGSETYEYGVGKNLNQMYVYFFDGSEQLPFEFMGWFAESSFKNRITEIKPTQTDTVTLYGKWRYHKGSISSAGQDTITDSGRFKQPYAVHQINLSLLNCDSIYLMGMRYLRINIRIRMWEKNDGYQYVFFYDGESKTAPQLQFWLADGTTTNEWVIEHGGTSKNTTPGWHEAYMYLDLNSVKHIDTLIIRYGASGSGEDTWYKDRLECYYDFVTDLGDTEDVNW